MNRKYSLPVICLAAFVLIFAVFQAMGRGTRFTQARGMPAATTASPPAFLPYVVKSIPTVTPSPSSTAVRVCPPTPIDTRIVCTPPPCPPGGHLECCYAQGCRGGCGTICITPPVTPTLTPTISPTFTAPPPATVTSTPPELSH